MLPFTVRFTSLLALSALSIYSSLTAKLNQPQHGRRAMLHVGECLIRSNQSLPEFHMPKVIILAGTLCIAVMHHSHLSASAATVM